MGFVVKVTRFTGAFSVPTSIHYDQKFNRAKNLTTWQR